MIIGDYQAKSRLILQHDKEIIKKHILSCPSKYKVFYYTAKTICTFSLVSGIIICLYAMSEMNYKLLFYLPFSTLFPCYFASVLYEDFTNSIDKLHKIPMNAKISILPNELVYYYEFLEYEFYCVKIISIIPYCEIQSITYDPNSMELKLRGKFITKTYAGTTFEVNQYIDEILIANIFSIDLYDILTHQCHLGIKEG